MLKFLVRGNVYELDQDKNTLVVSGVNNYTLEGKEEVKAALNAVKATADIYAIEIPDDVKKYLRS